jgi:peroxiredoxin
MKKSTLTISILLLGSAFGLAAYYALDFGFLTDADPQSRKLERLFGEMQVAQILDHAKPVKFRLPDIDGASVDLADFRGKIVFLNFWATWCPACVMEMSSMEKLYRKLKDRDFAMIAVSIEEPADRVKRFFSMNQLTFTALLDTTGETIGRLSIRTIPVTLILNKSGQMIGAAAGPRDWDSKSSLALFEQLIN